MHDDCKATMIDGGERKQILRSQAKAGDELQKNRGQWTRFGLSSIVCPFRPFRPLAKANGQAGGISLPSFALTLPALLTGQQ